MPRIINIAEEYSPFPGPRHENVGDFSGSRFREEILSPALKKESEITIILDGTAGFGSSFLEEVFGGLIRAGYTSEEVNSIQIVSEEDPTYLDEIKEYIETARIEAKKK